MRRIRPSQFIENPMDSVLKKSESETVARNIMTILDRTGDIFRDLTFDEYKQERVKDGRFSENEKFYFDKIISYLKSADTARLFSDFWNK